MARKSVIKFNRLNAAVQDVLKEYESYVSQGVCDRAFSTACEEAVSELKSTSPKRTGEYAASWTYKKDKPKRGKTKYIVYADAPHYRLTHLLEKGHAKRGGGRTAPGKVAAIPHIAPVDERVCEEAVKRVKEEIKKCK